MEAVTLGIPGIAFSFASREIDILASYADLLAGLVRRIVEVETFPKNMILNVNFPGVAASEVRGVRVTKLGSRFFSEGLTRMKDPWGKEVFWIGGGEITWTGDAKSDHQAVHDGYISITPLHMDLTSYDLFETVRGWSLEG
jgi:5'-nucleotidase